MKDMYFVPPEPVFITVNDKEYELSIFSEDIRICVDKEDVKHFIGLYESQEKKDYKYRRLEETKLIENCVVSNIEYNMNEQLIVRIDCRNL